MEAGNDSRRKVYLVTLPHPRPDAQPKGGPLLAPGSVTKEKILEKFLNACHRPIYNSANSIANGCRVDVAQLSMLGGYL